MCLFGESYSWEHSGDPDQFGEKGYEHHPRVRLYRSYRAVNCHAKVAYFRLTAD